MFTLRNLFKPDDWMVIWSTVDVLEFEYRRRNLSTGTIGAIWTKKVDVLIEIIHSKSRDEYKLKINTEDAKFSKGYSEAIAQINKFRGIGID